MSTWKDASGREWRCFISIALANKLRKEDGYDLLAEDFIKVLSSDALKRVHLLSRLCEQEAKERNITEEDVAELATATEEVATSAMSALDAAISDFFRRMGKRALADLVDAAAEAANKAEQQSQQMMQTEGRSVVHAAVEKAMQNVRDEIEKAKG